MDYESLRASLPEIADQEVDLHGVRLKNELARLLDAHLSGVGVKLLRAVGQPPYGVTAYDVLLNTSFLAYTCFERWLSGPEILRRVLTGQADATTVAVGHLLPLRITFAQSHPDRANAPAITVLDHRVFHSAVLGPAICYAERWDPTLFVADLLEQIGALLRFELSSDLDHPLNPQAAGWMASGHPGFEIPLR